MTRRVLACVSLTVTLAGLGLAAQTPARGPVPPRLVVLLVIDQFSGEYPDLYGQQWTHGLARLFNGGAVFPLAAYPYADTVTCSGHFTIGTGALPHTHGMVGDDWYDPVTKRLPECTTDPEATSVPFGGGAGTEHHSGRATMTPSFADELRLQSARLPRVLSISLKARSAIGMAGRHLGDFRRLHEDRMARRGRVRARASRRGGVRPDVDAPPAALLVPV
jgi:hypothetical protein